jgi:hypothetical protein
MTKPEEDPGTSAGSETLESGMTVLDDNSAEFHTADAFSSLQATIPPAIATIAKAFKKFISAHPF